MIAKSNCGLYFAAAVRFVGAEVATSIGPQSPL